MPAKTKKTIHKAVQAGHKKTVKTKHALKIKVKKPPVKKIEPNPTTSSLLTDNDLIKEAITSKNIPTEPKPSVILSENIEKDKNLILWSGVIFFMILIAFFWVRNTGRIFRETASMNDGAEAAILTEWQTATKEIAEKMNELKADLETIKTVDPSGNGEDAAIPNLENEEAFATTTVRATTTDIDIKAAEEEIKKLKTRLEELEGKMQQ
ncbi:MAG: hypothetical protein V1867_05255 [Candidatus Falkowbacteria bacterium]